MVAAMPAHWTNQFFRRVRNGMYWEEIERGTPCPFRLVQWSLCKAAKRRPWSLGESRIAGSSLGVRQEHTGQTGREPFADSQGPLWRKGVPSVGDSRRRATRQYGPGGRPIREPIQTHRTDLASSLRPGSCRSRLPAVRREGRHTVAPLRHPSAGDRLAASPSTTPTPASQETPSATAPLPQKAVPDLSPEAEQAIVLAQEDLAHRPSTSALNYKSCRVGICISGTPRSLYTSLGEANRLAT